MIRTRDKAVTTGDSRFVFGSWRKHAGARYGIGTVLRRHQLQREVKAQFTARRVSNITRPLPCAQEFPPTFGKFRMTVKPLAAHWHVRLAPVGNVQPAAAKFLLDLDPLLSGIPQVAQ